MERYGYIRASAKDQNSEMQYLAMKEQEVKQKNIYLDKMSGKSFARPQYMCLLRKLKKGDIVIVKSIDRLAKNDEEILEQWRKITKEIGTDIQVIDMPLLNTNTYHRDLTEVFIAELSSSDFGICNRDRMRIYQTETDRWNCSGKTERNSVGCKKEVSNDFVKYYLLWCEGKISLCKVAEELAMNYSTFC